MRVNKGKLHTVRLQHGSQTHIHSQAVVGIIDTCLQVGTQILHLSIQQGTEHILRIIPVVLYASRIADGVRLGMNRGTDGIYLHAAGHQRIDVEITLESGYRRRIEIHLRRLEVVSHILDEARDEVILTRSEIDMTKRETVSNLHLVNMMVLELGNQFFLQSHHLVQKLLIATMCIHVQTEIATCGNGMGGIPAGLDVHIHTARTIDAVRRTYRDIIHQSPNLMTVLQVRMHINMSAKRC